MPKKNQAGQAKPPAKPRSLGRLANLGPKSAQFLLNAGITSQEQLESLGSVRAYSMVKQVEPSASLNLLWALEGAISGLHWREVAKEHRTSLLLALETHEQRKQKIPVFSPGSRFFKVVFSPRPNPSIERTSPGKPGAASHLKR